MLFTVTYTSRFYSPQGFLGLEISTATAESGWRLGFVFVIYVFIFESSIVLSLITLYFHTNMYILSP
jgi:hypothetical protein